MLKGVMTAIVTPFQNGKVDEKAFIDLLEWQIQQGIHAIVVCGTTGEAPTLSAAEQLQLVSTACKQAGHRLPLIAGSGSNSTASTIAHTAAIKEIGVRAALIVTPYYNKPTQEGLFQHFQAVARAVDIPIIMYNVPGRTGVDMQPETVSRLAEITNIIGIKECAGLERIQRLRALVPDDFLLLSGEDGLNAQSYAKGAQGAISVASNILPAELAAIYAAATSGQSDAANAQQETFMPLIKALFIESSPIPVKTALALMGRLHEEFRLPLTAMQSTHKEELHQLLKKFQLVN